MATELRYGHEEETRDGGIKGREYGLQVPSTTAVSNDGGCVLEPCGPQFRLRLRPCV